MIRELVRLSMLVAGLAGLAVLGPPLRVAADPEPSVDAKLHVPILLRLLAYDRALAEQEPDVVKIVVVHDSDDAESRENYEAVTDVLAEFADKTINGAPFAVTSIDLAGVIRPDVALADIPAHAAYLTAGIDDQLDGVIQSMRAAAVLTMTATPHYIDAGISLAVEQAEGQPRVAVNLTALAEEGHRLDANVLRLCRVVEG